MRKEFRQGAYVVSVWLVTKILSQALSFNQKGTIYMEYYYNLLPFSFLDLLLGLYIVRTAIVFLVHFYGNRSVKE